MQISRAAPVPATRRSRCRGAGLGLAGLLATIIATACTPDVPLPKDYLADADTSPCGDVTYQNFAADFFGRYCLRCHNEQLIGDVNRFDAPTGINFNTLSDVRGFQARIRLRAGVQGDMPPKLLPIPQPKDEERMMLIRWIDCGTPEN